MNKLQLDHPIAKLIDELLHSSGNEADRHEIELWLWEMREQRAYLDSSQPVLNPL